jgi:NADPH-dependent 2,4-dienoyl-CoA reductase/sulfur reductase-like enzyme/nitrite reductase/ring-hydroxylating ferredoxin subunit
MAQHGSKPAGPDLTQGVSARDLRAQGHIAGHVGDAEVLVVQLGDDVVAVGARCTHYKGPLAEGLIVGDTVRCPWHHACFDLRTGEAVRAPALDAIACWRVERDADRIVVREKLPESGAARTPPPHVPASVVIVGGGAAGLAAADILRREGYEGDVTIVSADADPPYDRPNLSKDYLAGSAPEDWMPLKDEQFYSDNRIDLRLKTRVVALDAALRNVTLDTGEKLSYGALLVATGAEPVKLDVPGASDSRVHYLRTFDDSRAIIAALSNGARVAVIGASFIGLEVAASLRAREIETHVIGPEARPLERVMGPDLGDFVRRMHESKGVVFHLGETVKAIGPKTVELASGASIAADVVVVGIGVRPVTDWLEAAGAAVDRGVDVNEYLETNLPGVFAAGDAARWPDPHTGERIRVEHWVLAERMGQTAARNILGRREKFDAVPFFWSQHYDVPINYVGHATKWDSIEIDGDPDTHDCAARFVRDGRTLAIATVGRDIENLKGEVELERTSGRRTGAPGL